MRKFLKGMLWCLVFAIVLLAGILIGQNSGPNDENSAAVFTPPAVSGKATVKPTTAPKKAVPSKPKISGDDVVHIGEDVPAGTYRVATTVQSGENCYWLKSSDAEGSNIIDNDLPAGGRPQVTLKTGQWFTSRDCPDWIKK